MIIDVDNKDGKTGTNDMIEISQRLGALPQRPFVKTPTGGYHAYFKHPGVGVKAQGGVEYNGRKTGIDIRVGNSYIVAPPSIHPNGGVYQWVENDLLVPINNLPELPQAWIEQFLPLRDAPVDRKSVKVDTTTNGTENPSAVLPVKLEGEIERQAVKYLEKCPRSIQGRSGHNTLYQTAIALVRGFKLEPQRAADIAWTHYNPYCVPMWGENERKEFDRKFFEATKVKTQKNDGWLIDTNKIDNDTNDTLLAWEPFPIDCFPPVLHDFCLAVAKSTNTDPAYVSTFLLPILASAVGAHLKIQLTDDWEEPAIIWALVVADSGSGKTPTWKKAVKPLVKKQIEFNMQYDNNMKSHEKEKQVYEEELAFWRLERRKGKKDLKVPEKPEPPTRPYCLISDTTTEALILILAENPYGIISAHNEAAVWLGSFDAYRSGSNKDESIYNDIYDGGYVSNNRKSGNQFIAANHSHCSICGGIQPNSFKLILHKNPQFFHTGLFARLLLCMPPDLPRHFSDESVPKEIENAYAGIIEKLFSWRKIINATPGEPYIIKLTPEAKKLFTDNYNEMSNDRSALPSGAMKASLSKLSAYVPRIALTLHIAQFATYCPSDYVPGSFPDLEAETMRAAITLVEWFRRETQRVLQKVHPMEVIEGDTEITAIMRHIEKRDSTTARKVSQNLTAFKGEGGTERAEKKLNEMFLKGLLVCKERVAPNGITVKFYSPPHVTDTESKSYAYAYAISDSDTDSESKSYAYTYAISDSDTEPDSQENENSVGVGVGDDNCLIDPPKVYKTPEGFIIHTSLPEGRSIFDPEPFMCIEGYGEPPVVPSDEEYFDDFENDDGEVNESFRHAIMQDDKFDSIFNRPVPGHQIP